jgi:recombination protein RecR
VEEPGDILSLETSGEFRGTYHVLHGLISPMNGVGPEDIRINELVERLTPEIKEVVTALSPSVEGDVTAQYISKQITSSGRIINVTRLASGIPMGGELRYLDQVTIASAIRYRRAL